MPSAPRIKPRPASRTPRRALHILPNRQLPPASPAQNRPLLPLPPRPNRNRMPRQRLMTILASPVHPATPHLDRNNVQLGVVVPTPRLRIDFDPTHVWTLFSENGVLLLYRWWKPRTSSPGERAFRPAENASPLATGLQPWSSSSAGALVYPDSRKDSPLQHGYHPLNTVTRNIMKKSRRHQNAPPRRKVRGPLRKGNGKAHSSHG
jgi:hypothetical protein